MSSNNCTTSFNINKPDCATGIGSECTAIELEAGV
jgi:hypothetical protein